ncbi:hypothetical protein IAT38_005150 [Cryptococcus sp. DSM 104549]
MTSPPTPLPLSLPTITLLINNMHCTSCCDAISTLLSTLPAVRSVTTSLLLRTVTFSIDTSLSQSTSRSAVTMGKLVDEVVRKLQGEGGFVVEMEDGEVPAPSAATAPAGAEDRAEGLLSRLGLHTKRGRERKRLEERRRKHIAHCEACQAQEQASATASSSTPLTPPHAPSGESLIKSTFSIEGMTCASCTSSIVSALEAQEGIVQVDINLLNSSGVVRHRAGVQAKDVAGMIEDAGFGAEVVGSEVEEVVGQHHEQESTVDKGKEKAQSSATGTPGRTMRTVLSIEGMTCASCTSAITTALNAHPEVQSVEINLLNSSGMVRYAAGLEAKDVAEIVDDLGYGAEVVSSEPEPEAGGESGEETQAGRTEERCRSTFSIEGMTCASCSSAITSGLTGREGITAVHVDLLNNRGVVEHSGAITAGEIAEAIEDLGYGAEVVSTSPISSPAAPSAGATTAKSAPETRTLQVRVEGLFCDQCVLKINSHLDSLPLISHTPITLHSPVVTLTYKPHHPLTVRDILSGLSGLAPEFEARVQKTQSLSERSRRIQRREVKVLGWHLGVAFVLAIPTFIIAIVGMILVPGGNDLKMKMMEPKWGAANLGTLIMWPLATIVQFGVGRLFYQRTFASLWPHLRGVLPRALIPASQRRLPARPLGWRTFFSFGSMDLLVALSTTVSYFASLAMLIIDVRNPPSTESVGTYFDSCVFLIMFILLGRTLEAYAKSRTTDAVSLLGDLRPSEALLVERGGRGVEGGEKEGVKEGDGEESGSEETHVALEEKASCSTAGSTHAEDVASSSQTTRQIPVDHLELNDLILLPPGSLPPTDAILVSGHTTFDESSLTGESHAIPKSPGDEIFTGTTNLSSAVVVRVTRLGGDTMIEKIIRAVSDASSRKAPLEKLAERLTGVFVPLIVYLSLIILAVWLPLSLTGTAHPHSGAGGRVFFAIEFAIATLVVACPCGIGLAVPCANAVGNGVAAKAGVLAGGGGEAFLGATRVERVVFDKTGTLTVGRSEVTDELWVEAGERERDAVRRGVVELERGSTHPLAKGLVEYLDKPSGEKPVSEGRGELSVEVLETKEIAGRGLKARVKVDGSVVELLVGNVALMTDYEVVLSASHHESISRWSSEAKSVVLVAALFHDPSAALTSPTPPTFTLSVLFSLSDPPRPESASLIAALKKRGIAVSMLSGDNESTARAVGKMVGLEEDEVKGGVGPEGKAEVIRVYQEREGKEGKGKGKNGREVVMFVGDGLNDAVALAAADVSCAMGHGSQATLASADFILLSSSLSNLLALLRISRKVINRQRLNLGWAIVFNVVCLPFAAGVFYPAGGIRLTPVWSAVLMAASSVSVVCSSLAMRWGL